MDHGGLLAVLTYHSPLGNSPRNCWRRELTEPKYGAHPERLRSPNGVCHCMVRRTVSRDKSIATPSSHTLLLCLFTVATSYRLSYHGPWIASRPSIMGAFGDKFRKARESKELSFDDVSNVIKISPRMLRAIEEENFDQLPGGVFNKGFIRSYAKHIGLDPEEAITEYLDYVRQQQIQAQQAWQPEPPVETRAPAKAAAAKKSGASSTSSTKTEAP